jgi:hypothetical protein
VVLGLELRASTLSHSTSLDHFFVLSIFEIGSHELFAWAGFEPDPPDLCLLSSWDYRSEPPVPGRISGFQFRLKMRIFFPRHLENILNSVMSTCS